MLSKFMKKNGQSGFTLIELLVVIAIIGILSSVVLASLNTAREKSRDARRVADLGQLQLALELYFDSNGGYPSVLTALVPQFLSAVSVPPAGTAQAAYTYEPVGTGCTSYVVQALLEDGTHTAFNSSWGTDVAASAGVLTCPDAATPAATPAVSCDDRTNDAAEYCLVP